MPNRLLGKTFKIVLRFIHIIIMALLEECFFFNLIAIHPTVPSLHGLRRSHFHYPQRQEKTKRKGNRRHCIVSIYQHISDINLN